MIDRPATADPDQLVQSHRNFQPCPLAYSMDTTIPTMVDAINIWFKHLHSLAWTSSKIFNFIAQVLQYGIAVANASTHNRKGSYLAPITPTHGASSKYALGGSHCHSFRQFQADVVKSIGDHLSSYLEYPLPVPPSPHLQDTRPSCTPYPMPRRFIHLIHPIGANPRPYPYPWHGVPATSTLPNKLQTMGEPSRPDRSSIFGFVLMRKEKRSGQRTWTRDLPPA